jgi:hypothetical protein
MQCAVCKSALFEGAALSLYLREGRAELIELELSSRDRGWTDEGGICSKV